MNKAIERHDVIPICSWLKFYSFCLLYADLEQYDLLAIDCKDENKTKISNEESRKNKKQIELLIGNWQHMPRFFTESLTLDEN